MRSIADMLANLAVSELRRAPLFTRAQLAYAQPMESRPADSALMLRYRDGDVAAFEELYRRHKDSVFRYLLRLCGHRATAEDVFQEVWGKIIKARADYRHTAKFTTFLYRVAHNCLIDNVRRNKRHSANVEFEPEQFADNGDLPDALAEKALARRRMEAALADLPQEQRDTFLLYEEAGLTLDEIATVTGSNREATKSRLRYAVAKLRAAMDEPGDR